MKLVLQLLMLLGLLAKLCELRPSGGPNDSNKSDNGKNLDEHNDYKKVSVSRLSLVSVFPKKLLEFST